MKASNFYNQFRKTARILRRRVSASRIDERIFFLHVPKCGGTSVDAAISEAYGWKSCLHLDSAASRKASETRQEDLMEYRNSLLPYFMEQDGLRYISGHFVFDAGLYGRYGSQWRYITLLRHPVEKYLSQYFFNLQKQHKEHFGIEESLERFIESEEGVRLGQDMVQKITGRARVTPEGSSERQSQIELAIQHIEKFHLVGILEDLPGFEADFKKRFGASLHIKKMNRNSSKDKKKVSPAIRKKIESLCEPDLALYEHVKKMLTG